MSTYLIKDVELANGEKVDIGIADGVITELSKKATKSYDTVLDGSFNWNARCSSRWIHRGLCHGKH
jgi:hypothetical protein